jgi:hypothetical protein
MLAENFGRRPTRSLGGRSLTRDERLHIVPLDDIAAAPIRVPHVLAG